MTTSKKVNSFIKGFVALVTGDNATATAEKVLRSADNALNVHIQVLKGDLIGLEQSVEDAREAAKNALLNNGETINDRDTYVQGIIDADNAVTEAQEELKEAKTMLTFLEEKLAEINAETEVEAED